MKENINIRKRNYLTPTAEWVECEADDFIAISGDGSGTKTDKGNTSNEPFGAKRGIFETEDLGSNESEESEYDFEYSIP